MLKIEHAQTDPALGRREANKRSKLQRIVDAARQLFRDQGYSSTTTRAIAERAGIGVGTLFVYFPEKLDLLLHVFFTDISSVVDEAFTNLDRKKPALEQLLAVFGRLMDYYGAAPDLSRVFVKELLFLSGSDRHAELTVMTTRFMADLGRIAESASPQSELRLPAEVAGFHLFGQYYYHLTLWLSGAMNRATTDSALRGGLAITLRGLTREGKEPSS